nr:hypothetical protein CFP56_56546 [Quercus suber]
MSRLVIWMDGIVHPAPIVRHATVYRGLQYSRPSRDRLCSLPRVCVDHTISTDHAVEVGCGEGIAASHEVRASLYSRPRMRVEVSQTGLLAAAWIQRGRGIAHDLGSGVHPRVHPHVAIDCYRTLLVEQGDEMSIWPDGCQRRRFELDRSEVQSARACRDCGNGLPDTGRSIENLVWSTPGQWNQIEGAGITVLPSSRAVRWQTEGWDQMYLVSRIAPSRRDNYDWCTCHPALILYRLAAARGMHEFVTLARASAPALGCHRSRAGTYRGRGDTGRHHGCNSGTW